MISALVTLQHHAWSEPLPVDDAARAAAALEEGDVVLFPHLVFDITAQERALFSPEILTASKNARPVVECT